MCTLRGKGKRRLSTDGRDAHPYLVGLTVLGRSGVDGEYGGPAGRWYLREAVVAEVDGKATAGYRVR